MIIPRSKRKQKRLPLISLIDMTFLLFIFFILVTRFSSLDQLELNVGSSTATVGKDAQNPSLPLRILLRTDMVQIGDSLFSYANVGAAIKPYLPQAAVIIESEKDVSVQQMVNVLDAVKLAGATEITLKEAP